MSEAPACKELSVNSLQAQDEDLYPKSLIPLCKIVR